MQAMRDHWTDDRMDDLAQRVETGFASVDQRFAELHQDNRQLRREMVALRSELRTDNKALETELRADNKSLAKELRSEMQELRGDMNSRFKAIDRRFDVLLGTVLTGFVGLIVSQFIG